MTDGRPDPERDVEQPLLRFLEELPQRIAHEVAACMQGQPYKTKIDFKVPGCVLPITEDSLAYDAIKTFCAQDHINMRVDRERCTVYEFTVHLDANAHEAAAGVESMHQKFMQAMHDDDDRRLYDRLSGIPEAIEKLKKDRLEKGNTSANRYISISLLLNRDTITGYSAYQALHEYCSRPNVNVCIFDTRDHNYKVDYCVIDTYTPYERSYHLERPYCMSAISLEAGKKLPEPPQPQKPPEKKNFWKKLGF